jgi:hypothetical protein
VLRVGVQHDGAFKLRRHHSRSRWEVSRSTNDQNHAEVIGLHLGRLQGAPQRADSRFEQCSSIVGSEVFDAFRLPEDLSFARVFAQDRRVERAAIEVVHRNRVVLVPTLAPGVIRRGGFRLSHQGRLGQVALTSGFLE